jgi:elongation factor 1 alpha-like protein
MNVKKGKTAFEEEDLILMAKRSKEPTVDKKILNQIYPKIDYFKGMDEQEKDAKEENSKNLNLVIIGHVDSGKSTLTGHLLYKLEIVKEQEMRKMNKLCDQNNKASFQFAYIMDELEEERERGVTIELTTRFFKTPNRDFTILDAPGHRDFIANMITGSTQASCAVLVLDAYKNAFESGWDGGLCTTKEHAILARCLGVSQLVCVINKMDTCEWNQDRFTFIHEKLEQHLVKKLGFKADCLSYIPISGLSGENLLTRSSDPNLTSWYDGPCLVEVLD